MTNLMIWTIFYVFVLRFASTQAKGLYSGVPCHRAYNCIFEEDQDGFQNSLLVGEEEGVEDEETCQTFCGETENCISYTWWNENATERTDYVNGAPFLCQLFSVCHRNYQNPNLTPVHSGMKIILRKNLKKAIFIIFRAS